VLRIPSRSINTAAFMALVQHDECRQMANLELKISFLAFALPRHLGKPVIARIGAAFLAAPLSSFVQTLKKRPIPPDICSIQDRSTAEWGPAGLLVALLGDHHLHMSY
jgi:hypothetical protein